MSYLPEVVIGSFYKVKLEEDLYREYEVKDIRGTNIESSSSFNISVTFLSKCGSAFQTKIEEVIGNDNFVLLKK